MLFKVNEMDLWIFADNPWQDKLRIKNKTPFKNVYKNM